MKNRRDSVSMLRMPVTFGPRTGPRRGPEGRIFDNLESPDETTLSVSFLSEEKQLQAMLPEGFRLLGDPIVVVSATYSTNIEWLAGRGYNKLGVRIPATFKGVQDEVAGEFLCVLWENLADAILTGRDELGVPKIWCELPEPVSVDGNFSTHASWLGFRFLEMTIENLGDASATGTGVAERASQGDLHLKYVPKTGAWGEADVSYVTHIPAGNPNRRVVQQWSGDGSITFHRASWEDMPTQYNIVNRLADLEVIEVRQSAVIRTVGGKDLSDARILR